MRLLVRSLMYPASFIAPILARLAAASRCMYVNLAVTCAFIRMSPGSNSAERRQREPDAEAPGGWQR